MDHHGQTGKGFGECPTRRLLIRLRQGDNQFSAERVRLRLGQESDHPGKNRGVSSPSREQTADGELALGERETRIFHEGEKLRDFLGDLRLESRRGVPLHNDRQNRRRQRAVRRSEQRFQDSLSHRLV